MTCGASGATKAAVGVGIPMGIPMDMGMDGYWDCDKSPRACGDSIGILNGCEIKPKRVEHAINVVVDV